MVNPELVADLKGACIIVWAAVFGLIAIVGLGLLFSGVFS